MTRILVVAAATALSLSACKFLDPTSDLDTTIDLPDGGIIGTIPEGGYVGPDGRPALGGKVGDACTRDLDCRRGAACSEGTCAPTPTAAVDTGCVLSAECAEGLSCTIPTECYTENGPDPLKCGLARCRPSELRPEDADCTEFGQCARGLRCNLLGFTGVCEPEGTADIAQPCEAHSDCRDPLLCMPGSARTGATVPTCQIPAYAGQDLFLPDVECTEEPAETPFSVYFHVPGGAVEKDFYTLPFPSDIRRTASGTIDMSGHPNPGVIYLGGAIIDQYVQAAERLEGFSTNPAIYFRFTKNPDFGTLIGDGPDTSLYFVNIDRDSPGYGNRVAMRWSVTTGRGKFICPRYMAVRPAWSTPLEPDTTYAVFVTNNLRGGEGEIPTPQADFAAVIGDSAPSEARLERAWRAYEPLRDYLVDKEIGADTLLAAAVFTTMDPTAEVPAIRAGIRAQPAPTLQDVTVCGAGVTSPCDDGERGACVNPAGLTEIHARLRVPVWQHGTRPYLLEDDGGNFVFEGGQAVPSGSTEDICVSMTIPQGPMPEGGWPVVMYAHGTGGSFVSHLQDGTAGRVASINLGEGDPVRMVSISLDGAQHGPRRGDSDLSAETLFYNFLNPLTAVGNVQQGAADYFGLTYFLETASIDVPGLDDPVRFDPTQLYYFGHSQGATVGGLFAAYERSLQGAIFSGAGGSLVLSLLNKTSPEDIAGGVAFVLTDGGTSPYPVNDMDPLLALLQMVIDPVDPLNYARLYFARPPSEEVAGIHMFQSYGFGDTYSPEPNQDAFAKATAAQLPQPSVGNLQGFSTTEYPVSGNRFANGAPTTAVVVPAQPNGYDGHFVIFRDAELTRQSMEFLGTAVRDGVPTVTRR